MCVVCGVWCVVCVCVCVRDEMSISLHLSKHSGLLEMGHHNLLLLNSKPHNSVMPTERVKDT